MKPKLIGVFLLLLQLGVVAFAAQVHVSKSTFSKANGYFQIRVQTAQNTQTGESLIVWQKTTALGRDAKIVYRILNAKGKPITPARVLAKRSGAGTPTAAYNPVLDQYAIVYDETGVNGNDTPQVYGRLVNAKGKPLGKEIILSTDAVSSNSYNFSPQIIFNSNSGEFVMVWTRDQADTDENDGLVGLRLTQGLTPAGTVKLIRQGTPLDILNAFAAGKAFAGYQTCSNTKISDYCRLLQQNLAFISERYEYWQVEHRFWKHRN